MGDPFLDRYLGVFWTFFFFGAIANFTINTVEMEEKKICLLTLFVFSFCFFPSNYSISEIY